MVAIQTVLCPVDFSPASQRQLDLAVDLCRLFGARLVLHHNVAATPTGAGIGWMYAEAHPDEPTEIDTEARLREVLASLPPGLVAEGRVTRGLPSTAVVQVAELVGADLMLLATHADAGEEHTSVTEQVLERARCLVLALHEAGVDQMTPCFTAATERPQILLVPTDLSDEARPAVTLAFELARKLPLEVHLMHVEPLWVASRGRDLEDRDERRDRLAALVPADLRDRVLLHVLAGEPAREIAVTAERLGASCIVMGEHARGLLRRFLTHDTSRDVLRRAHCPVWFVPARAA